MKCRDRNKAGKPCGAPAVTGTTLCITHSGRAAEIGSRGGRRRAVYNLEELEHFPPPSNADELGRIVAQTMVEVRTGKIDPKSANAIGCLATAYLRVLEARKPGAQGINEVRNATTFQVGHQSLQPSHLIPQLPGLPPLPEGRSRLLGCGGPVRP
jgi:hypothetical protein